MLKNSMSRVSYIYLYIWFECIYQNECKLLKKKLSKLCCGRKLALYEFALCNSSTIQCWGSGSGSVGSATFWVSRSWSAKICGWTDPDSRGKISTSLLITKFYKINEWIKFKLELDSKQWFFSFFYFLLSLFSFYMFLFQRRLQKPVVRWGMLRRILY